MLILNYCFYWSSAVNLFRAAVYTFLSSLIHKRKVKVEAQNDPAVKELTVAWTSLIRTFMLFRGVVSLWATYLHENEEKLALVTIMLVFDIYILLSLIKTPKRGTVMQTRDESTIPILLQLSLISSGVIAHLYWYSR